MNVTILSASLVAAAVVIGIILALRKVRQGGKARNQRLAAWAKTVPLSQRQADAMWVLWQAGKAKRAPVMDPLSELPAEDVAYILKVCGADYRPREFGDASVLRLSSFEYFTGLGFDQRQAAVLVGMMLNMVGRRDL